MFEIQNKKFKVEKIAFYNKESMWGVLGTAPLEHLGDIEHELLNVFGNISISGNFGGVYEGCEIEVTGDVVNNPKFGKQIQIRSLKVLEGVKNKEGVINFLARSMIKGISVQNAKKIYEKYKEKAIDVVLNDAQSLTSIYGIGQKTVNKIKDSVAVYKAIKPLIEFCTELGLSYGLIMKLHKELGADAIKMIKEDPFKILEVSETISFKQVDDIYIKNGGNPTGRKRLECGLLYLLKDNAILEGSTGCIGNSLKNKFYKLLELDSAFDSYEKVLAKLEDEGKVTTEVDAVLGQIVYYKEYADIEKSISEKIKYLDLYGILSDKIDEKVIEEEIGNFPFTLNEQQVAAVKRCLNKPVSVLTGPAGCIGGDVYVDLLVNNAEHHIKLEEAYRLFKAWKVDGFDVYIKSYIQKTGKIEYNEVEDITFNGGKATYSLDFGYPEPLTATADHKISITHGFIPVSSLSHTDPVRTEEKNGRIGFRHLKNFKAEGTKPVYDVCCYKDHNFVANGIVVHNCGKSSITKALYNIYRRCGFKVVLLSPTAKAALRLSECTGGTAQTIHRFLGMTKNGDAPFNPNEDNLDNTVVIIDEASMMDIMLFNNVLKRATVSTKILLVGDNNQLPSVQAGNVLGDLIFSGQVPVSILTDVMRQGEDSHIIKYCNMINNGEIFEPCEVPDFHYEEFGTVSELRELFIPEYLKKVKEYGLQEVQVITPYKKGELGMNNLNILLQDKYNAKGAEALEPYRIGDRVRHTVNNYKKGVFNGETGIISSCEDGELIVDYGDRFIPYDNTDIEELALAYCSTVHASQGSEYKVCFVILDDTAVNDFLFIRRLLYTAVSRGKKKVYILSKPYLLDKCITNASYRPRITKLKDFLKEISSLAFA